MIFFISDVRVFVSSKEWKGHWEVDYKSFVSVINQKILFFSFQPPQNLADYYYLKFLDDPLFKIGEKLNHAVFKTKGFRPRE